MKSSGKCKAINYGQSHILPQDKFHPSNPWVPLSCRFFMRGEPPHKNAACGYPRVEELAILITGARCE
jgi:hypothetical protein